MQHIVFNSTELPGDESLRKNQWIEQLSSGYVRLNADPVKDTPFCGELRIAALKQVAVGTIEGTVEAVRRTAREIALEDTDNLVLLCNAGEAPMRITQNGTAVDLSKGGSVLIEQSRPSAIITPHGKCRLLALQAPRSWLRARLPAIETQVMTPIIRYSAALGLAQAYANALLQSGSASPGLIATYAPDHIADLMAAAIAQDHPETSKAGVRAARLRALKDDIAIYLGSRSLSASDLASRHGISVAYVRKLFSTSGTSFSDFVLAERLGRACRMLRDPRFASRPISAIAYEVGFSDLSYFNRTFRRRYNATPSDVRAGAR